MSFIPGTTELRGLFEVPFRAEQPAHRPFVAHAVASLPPGAEPEPVTAGASFCPHLCAGAHVGEFADLAWGYGFDESLRAAVARFGTAAAAALRRLADRNGGRVTYGSSRVLAPFPLFEVDGVAVGLAFIAPDVARVSWCFGVSAQEGEP